MNGIIVQIVEMVKGCIIMINVKMKVGNFSHYDNCAYCGKSHDIMYVYQWGSLFGAVTGDRYCGDDCYNAKRLDETNTLIEN